MAGDKGSRGVASAEFEKMDTVDKNRAKCTNTKEQKNCGGLAYDERGRKAKSSTRSRTPEEMEGACNLEVTQIVSSASHCLALVSSGDVYAWGEGAPSEADADAPSHERSTPASARLFAHRCADFERPQFKSAAQPTRPSARRRRAPLDTNVQDEGRRHPLCGRRLRRCGPDVRRHRRRRATTLREGAVVSSRTNN